MKIQNINSQPGKIIKGNLVVARYNHKLIKIPIIIAEGRREGPTVLFCAGMHGDEINSIETISRFLHEFNINKLKGVLIILPIVNPWGFKQRIRYIPFDNLDLNRCFGKKGKSVSYQIAGTIMKEIVSKCDFGIDIHDSGSKNILLPHPRILRHDKSHFLKEMSYALGTDIILEREGSPGMMAIESLKSLKIPILTFEVGGALVLNEEFIEQGIRGIKNVLVYNEVYDGIIDLPIRQFFMHERQGYQAPISGILHILVHLGEAVKKGQVIARIHNPLEDKEIIIKSQNPGIVFSVRKNAIIDKGESILSILHFKVHRASRELIPVQAQMLLNKERLKKVITRPTIILDDLFAVIGFSYKIVGKTIRTPFKRLSRYLR